MTGTDFSADPGARPGRRWDVALSFAGAQRDYVGQVAEALKARGVRCFYDADEQVRLWGTYLAEELPRIYAQESAAVVVFISADYAGRDWTRLERRAAFSRAVVEAGVYVLPARFDDSDLPGMLPDVVSVDLRRNTPGQFADLIVAKLSDLGVSPSLPSGRVDQASTGGTRVSGAAAPRGDERVLETGSVRRLIAEALSDDELTELCLDHFPSVYGQFAQGMSRSQRIIRLVEYCARRGMLPDLARLVHGINPGRQGEPAHPEQRESW
jgi:hypothetical protein